MLNLTDIVLAVDTQRRRMSTRVGSGHSRDLNAQARRGVIATHAHDIREHDRVRRQEVVR